MARAMGRTGKRDVVSTTWILVRSPQGVPPGTPVEVSGDSPVRTEFKDTVRTGRHILRLIQGGMEWSADVRLDEARPDSHPYEIKLWPAAVARSGVRPLRAPDAAAGTERGPDAGTVIYVHGIGNKPVPSVLQCQWDTALFRAPMGDRTRMAYWVDRARYVRPLDATCGEPDGTATDDDEATTTRILGLAAPELPQDGSAREAAALAREIEAMEKEPAQRERLTAMAARIAAMAWEEPPPREREIGRVSARVLPLPERERGLIARLLTRILLKDVNDFLTKAEARQRMTKSLLDRLRGGGEPFVIVAHSQGTMVAYEVLRHLRREQCDVALLVTMGSPLGLQEVQDHFQADGSALAVPECVGRWVNVADRMDPVAAADPRLENEYGPNSRGVRVEDEVGWWINPDSPRHPHSATGYLATREVREAVRKAVGQSFAQPVSKSVLTRDVAAGLEDGGPDALHDVLLQLADAETGGAPRSLDKTAETLIAELRRRAAGRPAGLAFEAPDRMRRFLRVSLTRSEIEALRTLSAELHVKQVWANARKRAVLHVSAATVQARTANLGYAATGRGIGWAVLDSGIDATHPHFHRPDGAAANAVRAQWDCTVQGKPPVLRQTQAGAPVRLDFNGHGTHVAATIAGAGGKVRLDGAEVRLAGMAPEAALYGFKVLDDEGEGDDAAIIKALDLIAEINEKASALVIHGVNLSLGSNFDPRIYGCGHTPLCQELRRLWRQGVLVCVAAGNEGYAELRAAGGTIGASMDLSIGDPANLEEAIAVGSVHKMNPHTFGVSYFSSRGPTADGRRKPDLVAPGERVLSARHGSGAGWRKGTPLDADVHYVEMSGTSVAAPHVSGVLAAFLSVRREFIGEPDRVKRILLGACTDLGRDPNMQGAGLANLVKMLVGR